MGRQARSAEQKEAKRDRILAAARGLFREHGYDDTDVASIARESGIAKGTVYLYFESKEEIFLELHRRAWGRWVAAMREGLDDPSLHHSIPKVVGVVTRTLDENRELTDTIIILHTRLEQNISEERALAFKEELRDGITELGRLMEDHLDFLRPGDGATLLVRTRAMIIGLSHLTHPSPVVADILSRDDMRLFRVDLSRAVTEMLTVMLTGVKKIQG